MMHSAEAQSVQFYQNAEHQCGSCGFMMGFLSSDSQTSRIG